MSSPRVAVWLLLAVLSPFAMAQSPQLNGLLNQLDLASAKFKSVEADVVFDQYTKLVKDHDLSYGTTYLERVGDSVNMGARTSAAAGGAPTKIVSFTHGTLQVYSPGVNQVDVFSAGANQAKYQGFLTLGFGGSGRDLAKTWNIQDLGPKTVDGVQTEMLDLTGKDPGIANTFTHVTIWIDPVRDVSLKQVFYQPSGDSRTATYTKIRMNPKVDTKPYAIPAKATRITH